MSTRSLGRRGEESAAQYLVDHGYTILGRNVQLGHLEVDILAKTETHLVFAEVKTRRGYPGVHSRYGRPAQAVDARKRHCLISAVAAWRRAHPGEYDTLIPNIDILEVYIDPFSDTYRVLSIRHFRNAVGGERSTP